jgi:uncharacterized damage-inducible protein DinB
MSASTLLHSLFKYKAWANGEFFTAMKQIDEAQHPAERHTAIRILNHAYVVDRIFAANLQQLPHEYRATNTEETPELDWLRLAVSESDHWYMKYVAALSEKALAESIDFTFTDGASGRMSREEMLAHVVNHGTGHRGAVARIMTQLSVKPPKDVFTGYLHKFEPAERRR